MMSRTARVKPPRDAELPPVRELKAQARAGDSTAEMNIPIAYRDLGNLRRAFFWWMKLADRGDGDAQVDAGYCYHYGIGVRKNVEVAKKLYRHAIVSRNITEYRREEAMYHLAILLLDGPATAKRRTEVIELLERADRDGDYPEAARVVQQVIGRAQSLIVCCCRRGLWKHIKGQAHCAFHRPIRQKNKSLQRALPKRAGR